MQPIQRFVIIAATIFLCSTILSPPLNAATLRELLMETSANHDLVRAAEARKEAAAQNVRAFQADRLPRVDLNASLGPERVDFPGDKETTSMTRNFQSVRASQILLDFGKSGSAVDRSLAEMAMAEVGVVAARQDILLRGISAYYNVLRHDERLNYARQSENRITELTGLEETLVDRKAGLASDVLQAQSQLAGARALRTVVEGQLANARSAFRGVFGSDLPDGGPAALSKPTPPHEALPMSLEEAVQAAMTGSPALLSAEYAVAAARHEVRSRQARYYPDVHLVGEAKRRENDLGVRGARNEALGMVELTFNLYGGGRDLALSRQAASRVADEERRLEDLRRGIEEQVRTAWQDLLTSRANAELLRRQAAILGEFLEVARKERRLGVRSLLDVLNGEVNYINALGSAASAETDEALAVYALLFAMGRLDLEHVR